MTNKQMHSELPWEVDYVMNLVGEKCYHIKGLGSVGLADHNTNIHYIVKSANAYPLLMQQNSELLAMVKELLSKKDISTIKKATAFIKSMEEGK